MSFTLRPKFGRLRRAANCISVRKECESRDRDGRPRCEDAEILAWRSPKENLSKPLPKSGPLKINETMRSRETATASVKWNPDALNRKLKQVQRTTHLESLQESGLSDRWTAVYGRLEAPHKLQAQSTSGSRSHSGNGYGANGSVPARLYIRQDYDFPR